MALVTVISYSHAQPAIPVDLVTGRAQVSVPLTVISDGSLSVPVLLSYDASGVKVYDADRHAGMGWSISAGGGVYRQVRSLPDDYNGNPNDVNDLRRGWLISSGGTLIGAQVNAFTQSSDASAVTYTDEASDYIFFNNLGYTKDTEPDLYTFSAPGLSGSFVFGTDGLPKLIPYQDVKIAVTGIPITSFVITKNDGTKYTFNITTRVAQFTSHHTQSTTITQFRTQRNLYKPTADPYELVYNPYGAAVTYSSSWELSSIETHAGEKIQFTFLPERVRNTRDYVAISSVSNPSPDTTWYYDQEVGLHFLKKVESSSRKIEFEWSYVDEIISATVRDKATGKEKKFNFVWEDVRGTDQPTQPTSRRFLTTVYESLLCDSYPSFKFEYYGVSNGTIPIPFNNPKVKSDIWGYYNGNAINNNPTIYYYANRSGSDRYRFYEIPGETATATINGGSDRAVNPTVIMYGSLKMINYPTGGQSEIVYEPNEYHDVAANLSKYGPGLRVKQVITRDLVGNAPETVIDYEYKTSDNKSSGKWIYRSAFAYHDVTNLYATSGRDNSPEPQVMYERVSVLQPGKGKVITEFKMPGMDPGTSGAGEYSVWTAARTYVARSGNISVGQLTSDFYQMPFAPNIKYDFERGLVSKVSTINSAGTTVHEKVYTYQGLNTTSTVVKGLRYELLKNSSIDTEGSSSIYVFSLYPVLTNTGRVIYTETERVADMNDNTKWNETITSYTFSSLHQMLTMTSVMNSDGMEHRTKFRYAKDYANLTNPSSDVNSNMIKRMNDPANFMHGSTVASISSLWNGSEIITGATTTLYGEFPDSLSILYPGVQGVKRMLPVETKVTDGVAGWQEPAVSPGSGSNQVLTFPGSYYTTSKVEQYDYIGTPLTVRTRQKTLNGVIMGYGKSLPVAIIANAAANEVVYDGFETYTGFGFDVVSSPPSSIFTYPVGWSGKKGLGMFTNATIQRAGISKGKGPYYRYSIRVNGSSSNITFGIFNGATSVVSAVVNHTGAGWKYYEGRISMAGVPSQFILKVQNTAAVTIDDVTFYPESSSLSSSTYEPLFGKTSETDTRGSSVFYEYDQLGRIKHLKDQDKTLRQHTDYYYKTQPAPKLKSDFSSSIDGMLAKNEPVTYTAPTVMECISGVNYDWYVDNVKVLDNSTTFNTSFSTAGKHYVKMVAEHLSYAPEFKQVEVEVVNVSRGPLDASVTTGSLIYTNCDPNYQKTFTATLGGCYIPDDISIKWFYKLGGSTWTEMSGGQILDGSIVMATVSEDGMTMMFDANVAFNGPTNLNDYQVKYEVKGRCYFDHGNDFGKVQRDVVEMNIDFQFNPNCL